LLRFLILLIVLGAAWGAYMVVKQLPQRQQQVPTAKVLRGDVVIRAYSRGELRAVRSATLSAPNLFGTVQVTKIAPLGSLAHDKDLIVEFDDSERRASLEETQLEVDQIDEPGRSFDQRQPGSGESSQVAVWRAPRGTGSAAQRAAGGD